MSPPRKWAIECWQLQHGDARITPKIYRCIVGGEQHTVVQNCSAGLCSVPRWESVESLEVVGGIR